MLHSDIQDKWNYIEQLSLDKLNNAHHLLGRMIDSLKSSEVDLSRTNLYEYCSKDLFQQCQENQIKDFPLEEIDYIHQFYEQTINRSQHCLLNVSDLLRVPLERHFDAEEFHHLLLPSDDQQNESRLQEAIENMTKFLNDLKNAEEILLKHLSRSLREICQDDWHIKNPILGLIPAEIKCQNYLPLRMKLIEIRAKLQEKIIQLNEKNTILWSPNFGSQDSEEQTIFQRFKNPNIDPFLLQTEPASNTLEPDRQAHKDDDILLIDFDDFSTDLPSSSHQRQFLGKLDYTPCFGLIIKSAPFISSTLFNTIRKQMKSPLTSKKALNYKIIYTDGTSDKHFCRIEKIYEQLKKHFEAKTYDYDQLMIVDQNHLVVDFRNENHPTSKLYLSEEYRVIDKNCLISIILEFEGREWKYSGTNETRISSIINRFLLDREIPLTSNEIILGVFDELGKYIEDDASIAQIYRSNNIDGIRIKIVQSENETSKLSEITLRSKKGREKIDSTISNFCV